MRIIEFEGFAIDLSKVGAVEKVWKNDYMRDTPYSWTVLGQGFSFTFHSADLNPKNREEFIQRWKEIIEEEEINFDIKRLCKSVAEYLRDHY